MYLKVCFVLMMPLIRVSLQQFPLNRLKIICRLFISSGVVLACKGDIQWITEDRRCLLIQSNTISSDFSSRLSGFITFLSCCSWWLL